MCNNDILNRLINGDKIIEVGAKPKEDDKPNEKTKFDVFKEAAKEKLTTAVDLAEIAGSGVAHKKDAEAKKTYAEGVRTVEEAKRIAVEKEHKAEEWELDKTIKRNKIIDDIFREGQQPAAQQMKLLNYFRTDPDILEAFGDLQNYVTSLSFGKGTIVQFTDKQIVSGTEGEKLAEGRAGKRWSDDEEKELQEEDESGMNIAEMARKHKRTMRSIQLRLKELEKRKRFPEP